MTKSSFAQLKILITTLALMLTFAPGLVVRANENFTCDYTQTNFDEDDGFESGEANCICQSESGYIWVGTDSGLYRYDGNQFKLFYLGEDNTDRTFKVTSLIYTSESVLYVGTENYGLFVYNSGVFSRVSAAMELGIATINQMYEDEDGILWLATAEGIYYYDGETISALESDALANAEISAIDGYDNFVYAIANNDTFVCIKNRGLSYTTDKTAYTEDDLTCLTIDQDGVIYLGTSGHYVIKVKGRATYQQLLAGSISGINKVAKLDGYLWVLADDGVSRINDSNDEASYATVTNLEFNDAMTDVICDFEGNYWLASYRHGLLLLEQSKFTNGSIKYAIDDTIVNCVTQFNGATYVGTDNGLYIINSDGSLDKEAEIYTMLSGKSIRDLYVDSKGKLWICTYRTYGVVCLSKNGNYNFYNKGASGVISNYVNCIIELADGSMAIGTESGVSILGEDGVVTANYTKSSGMFNTDIVSLYQDDDGTLYAGSNGSGMYIIDLEKEKLSAAENISANYISAIIAGTNGAWIGTDNGLYYMEGSIRQISSIDTSNSISDLIMDQEGSLWIFGSKGIQVYYEVDLLSSSEPSCTSYTKGDGLISSITENSFNYISDDGKVYICCDEGLSILDTENTFTNDVAPQVRIATVTIDDVEYAFADLDGTITVPADASRLVVKFAVLSYVNRSNIAIKYYLEGFEDEARTLAGNEYLEAEYTNLAGGTYTFVLSATNCDGVECIQELSFQIVKEAKFYETNAFTVIVVLLFILLAAVVFMIMRYLIRLLISRTRQVESLSNKTEEAEKANRAKNDYVNYLNSEIRAPLNSIIALSEMLLRNGDSENQEELTQFATLNSAGVEILDMVEGISRLANIQDGAISLNEKQYAATDLIHNIELAFADIKRADQVKLKVSIEDDIPNGLMGDPAKIKEIITNIYERAVATTKEGYISLDVDWRRADDKHIFIDFVVADTGMGVKEERLTNFFTLGDSYDRTDVGNLDISIGVAIAYELILMMDGAAEVTSNYGAGTTVRFSIKQRVFDAKPVNYNAKRRQAEELRNSDSRLWFPDVRILLVDDQEISCHTGKVLLESYELICDTATSGFEAVDKIMLNDYDLIFVDEVMPVMDGADTVREIRGLEGDEYKNLPIIALSETGVDSTIDEILAKGFDDAIEKPMEVDDIERIFYSYLEAEKVKEKSNDIGKYISESRYKDQVDVLANSISVEDALKLLGGKFDTFNHYVESFKKDNQESFLRLGDYVDTDIRTYKNLIHQIRVNGANLGANGIVRKAGNLESAINIGNLEYAKDNTPELVSMLEDLFNDIGLYLSRIKGADGDVSESPTEVPSPDTQETSADATPVAVDTVKLRQIRAMFRDEKLAEGKATFAEMMEATYDAMDADFMAALSMTITSMDYAGACEIIDQYLNSI